MPAPLPAATLSTISSGSVYNALQMGVKRSTTVNQIPAINAALIKIHDAGGGTLQFPPGKYLLACTATLHVNIPEYCGISGSHRVSDGHAYSMQFPANLNRGGTLFYITGNEGDDDGGLEPTGGDKSAIQIGEAGWLENIAVWYPNLTNTNPPTKYPYAIMTKQTSFVTIRNIGLINCYQGIFINFGSRALVENVHGSPFSCGVKVDNTWDISLLNNIEFVPIQGDEASLNQGSEIPANAYMRQNGVCFQLSHSDGLLMTNCSAYYYGTFIQLGTANIANGIGTTTRYQVADSQNNRANGFLYGAWVTANNCLADYCGFCVLAYSVQTNGCLFNNCFFSSKEGQAIVVTRSKMAGSIKFSNCHFGLYPATIAIRHEGSGSVSLINTDITPTNANLNAVTSTSIFSTTAGYLSVANCDIMVQGANLLDATGPILGIAISGCKLKGTVTTNLSGVTGSPQILTTGNVPSFYV